MACHLLIPLWRVVGTLRTSEPRALATDLTVTLWPRCKGCHHLLMSDIGDSCLGQRLPSLVDAKGKLPSLVDAKGKLPSLVDAKGKLPSLVDAKGKLPSLVDGGPRSKTTITCVCQASVKATITC